MMRTFYVATRVMGGEWFAYLVNRQTWETQDLAQALGLAATLRSDIKEAMVGAIDTVVTETEGGPKVIQRTYSLVDIL
jgi:hypothetical protein